MTQYVLYNTCYGGFSFNRNFVVSLFKRFPPSTLEGQKLFRETYEPTNGTESPFFGTYVFVHQECDYPKNEARYIKDISTKKIYYIDTYMTKHRANPDIIKFLFERAESMSEEEFNNYYDKLLEKVLFDSERMLLVSENNTKKYTFQNWKDSKLLISHILTIGISDKLSDLQIEQVKPELTWRIHEYDGSESVVVRFDYFKLISELVHELRINKIQPSSDCSDLMAKIIQGNMSIQELKDFEHS
jgi:hypothetical protein